jgi:AhpD family alkylhydroperoxidase
LLTVFRSLVVEDPLLNLVAARTAQLNHCASSLAAHVELARRQGEHPMRLCHLSAWRDSSLFGPRERAALEWAEILAASPEPASLKPADSHADIGLSAKDVSTLSFVVAVVILCGRLQLAATAA